MDKYIIFCPCIKDTTSFSNCNNCCHKIKDADVFTAFCTYKDQSI